MKFLTILFFILPIYIFAQTVSDTVYLATDTIYKKTVVEIVEYENFECHFSGSAHAGIVFNSCQQEYAKFRGSGYFSQISAMYSIEDFFAKIGCSYSTFQYSHKMWYTRSSINRSTQQITDTLTSYAIVIDGKKDIHYITKTKSIQNVDTTYTDSILSFTNSYQIIGIPIYIGRNIARKKITYSLAAEVVPQFIIGNDKNLTEESGTFISESPRLQPTGIAIGGEASVAYNFWKSYRLFFSYCFLQQITNSYTAGRYHLQSHRLSFGINLSFY